jgi:hypothetical protein
MSASSNAPPPSVSGLRTILNESVRKVPFNVYAWGVVGIVAAAALCIILAGGNWLSAVAGGTGVFVGMVVLRIISPPSATPARAPREHSTQAIVLTWICLMAFAIVLALFIGKLFFVLFPGPGVPATKTVAETLGPITLAAGDTYRTHVVVGRPGPIDVELKSLTQDWKGFAGQRGQPGQDGLLVTICPAEKSNRPAYQMGKSDSVQEHDDVGGPVAISVFNFQTSPKMTFSLLVKHPS